jgi:hypothetical protein
VEAGEYADEERADAHQRHRNQERVFAADQIAEMAEDQRPERANREPGCEREQREDEADVRRNVGEKVLRQKRAERAVDVKVIPFETPSPTRTRISRAVLRSSCLRCAMR